MVVDWMIANARRQIRERKSIKRYISIRIHTYLRYCLTKGSCICQKLFTRVQIQAVQFINAVVGIAIKDIQKMIVAVAVAVVVFIIVLIFIIVIVFKVREVIDSSISGIFACVAEPSVEWRRVFAESCKV